jgi:hypothetical protein
MMQALNEHALDILHIGGNTKWNMQYHCTVVKYDRNRFISQDVLASIESQDVNARLVGQV